MHVVMNFWGMWEGVPTAARVSNEPLLRYEAQGCRDQVYCHSGEAFLENPKTFVLATLC